jgi:hypothetical protein
VSQRCINCVSYSKANQRIRYLPRSFGHCVSKGRISEPHTTNTGIPAEKRPRPRDRSMASSCRLRLALPCNKVSSHTMVRSPTCQKQIWRLVLNANERRVDYSAIANVLDYTSGSIPVTFADRALDARMSAYEPLNLTDRAVWQTCKRF